LVVATRATKIRPIPAGDASSFIIHDNSSEIAKFIPEKYVEPLVIIARILGFDGIDDYIIHLIKDRLEMFADTYRDDLDDSFQEYLHDMIIGKNDVPDEWTRSSPTRHNRRDHSTKTTTTEEATKSEGVEDTNENEEDD
jgi:hypothetical protein